MESTAFVLSGGASLGALQAGMLHALYERGVRPDLVVATSTGALNGAFISARPQTVDTAEELCDVWRSVSRGQVFPLNPITGLFGFAGLRPNLLPGGGIRRLIVKHMRHERLEELPIPLHLIATDVQTGEEVRLSEGPLTQALLASAAVPGVFAPVELDGHTLMDGGVANNTPISHAVELGASRIYVLSTGPTCALDEMPQSALGMFVHALNLLVHRRLAADIEQLRTSADLIVLPVPCPLPAHPLEFRHADLLIESALEKARDFLDRTYPGSVLDMDAARTRRRERCGTEGRTPAA